MEKAVYTRIGAERRALLPYLPSWMLKTPSFFVRLRPQHDRYGPNQLQTDSSDKASSHCVLVGNNSWNSLEHWPAPDWNSSTTSRDSKSCSVQKHLLFPTGHKTLKLLPTESSKESPFITMVLSQCTGRSGSQFNLPLPEGIRALLGSNPLCRLLQE